MIWIQTKNYAGHNLLNNFLQDAYLPMMYPSNYDQIKKGKGVGKWDIEA